MCAQGYAPLSIRLVETALSPTGLTPKANSSLAEALSALPGASFDITQPTHISHTPGGAAAPISATDTPRQTSGSGAAGGGPATTAVGMAGSSASSGGGGVSGSVISTTQPPQVVLVVFIGGVTYSEVSALRWLASRSNSYRFRILTSQVGLTHTHTHKHTHPYAHGFTVLRAR